MTRRATKALPQRRSAKKVAAHQHVARRAGSGAAVRYGGLRDQARAATSARELKRYVGQVAQATPLEMVELERKGVAGPMLKDLSKRLGVPTRRMFEILGIPKATAENKAARGERVAGSGGQAALGILKLLAIAEEIVGQSTAGEAKGFDTAAWLGRWLGSRFGCWLGC